LGDLEGTGGYSHAQVPQSEHPSHQSLQKINGVELNLHRPYFNLWEILFEKQIIDRG
jgi:hypothetical protein